MSFDCGLWIIDFGSQYTQLITRKIRELGFKSIIMTFEDAKSNWDNGIKPTCVILSGGPDSVQNDQTDYSFIFSEPNLAVLGICYGMQLMAKHFKGNVIPGVIGEYGHSEVDVLSDISGIGNSMNVWMSHSDHLEAVPKDFNLLMKSSNDLIAGMAHKSLPLLALQFHPEVEHTEHGKEILKYFLNDIAKLSSDWKSQDMVEEASSIVKKAKGHILCAFSGGVDSLVAATLAHKELKGMVYCFFVDNGLLRPQDYHHIESLKAKTDLNIEVIDAKSEFLSKLEGISDPEKKRKIIGNTFIEVFEKKVHEYEENHNISFEYLLQGTLYPDVIESISPHKKGGKSVTIKSHHNVGGLPERMKLKLLEPFRFLFKDEVRVIGEKLGLHHEWVHRHPFPGPGIGVRVLGELTEERIKKVQASDQILFEELHSQKQYNNCWQAFTVLLPVKTVGVKGDYRAYEEVICLRVVNSSDGMTARWTDFPYAFLDKVSRRITNEVKGITRVVYDITSKPPGTIEWE